MQALDAGADDYITKPFGFEELLVVYEPIYAAPRLAKTGKHCRLRSVISGSIWLPAKSGYVVAKRILLRRNLICWPTWRAIPARLLPIARC